MTTQAQRVTNQLRDFTGLVARTIATATTNNLRDETPVDTGLARANWIPSVGAPNPLEHNIDFDRRAERETQVGPSEIVQAAGRAEVGAYSLERGSNIFIGNALPYIEDLGSGILRGVTIARMAMNAGLAAAQNLRR